MINLIIVLASVTAIVVTTLVGRKFVDVEDTDDYLVVSESDEYGWVPAGMDELILEATRRDMATYTKASGLPY